MTLNLGYLCVGAKCFPSIPGTKKARLLAPRFVESMIASLLAATPSDEAKHADTG